MNKTITTIIKDFSYTLGSNTVTLIISTLVVLIIPKVIGIEDYGYWQLYLFYISYVGFLHFGWTDGIYLRYGGERYENLDKKRFFSQYVMLSTLQLLIAIIIVILISLFGDNPDKNFIFKMIAISMFLMNIRAFFIYVLQATARIKEYSVVTIIGRILYAILIFNAVLMRFYNYKLMILADVIGTLFSTLVSMYYCKEIVMQKPSVFVLDIIETKNNIFVGMKLMFASIASQLIIGIVRFAVEHSWNVATFGKVSLTLSISNMMMIFINALGIVMFPILRRTDQIRFSKIYEVLCDFILIILFGFLVFYFPLRFILSAWLPKYADSLKYMALLFPMIIFEGKLSLLINTYLKTIRQEKVMLRVNLITVIFSVILTIITTIFLRNLDLTILSIVLLLGFRCTITELKLAKLLNVRVIKNIVFEWLMSAIFIILGWFFYSMYAAVIYLIFYMGYLFIKRKDIVKSLNGMKTMLKS